MLEMLRRKFAFGHFTVAFASAMMQSISSYFYAIKTSFNEIFAPARCQMVANVPLTEIACSNHEIKNASVSGKGAVKHFDRFIFWVYASHFERNPTWLGYMFFPAWFYANVESYRKYDMLNI